METYTLLRSFADSWYLLFMALFFVGIIAWAWRPGSRKVQQEVAASIFRNDDRPADDGDRSPSARQSQGAR
ncbi:cbb3-type cytochrome c oxidase subunit 3 [Pararhodobacter zhoushanensis]|uniref:Cbb3-type cytochrome c oxidase subunit 3 n=1 Tax=Pararhodobacter zhoushanensis TaxID=2479545 RepID=A0ABT3H4V9_9RHOB|nr:cbb3-type cytochrome c oxidase subunit 3 [Pararhodobacter zhoushanensis]MCW1934856.1 cbb3-type cytochrome c oxidase subunit 3 [Pararhodobacter zhoushanensis]